jgi:hypothetical protein
LYLVDSFRSNQPKWVIRDLSEDKTLSFKLFEAAYKVLKRKGLTAGNIEWFANAIDIGTINLPELHE